MEHFESLYPATTRENEISKILSFIKEGNSCQVISLPGGGRSNLLGLLTYNRNVRIKHLGKNQKWFHFVLCNFAEVRKRPLFDITKFLFLNLVDSLRDRGLREEHQQALKIFKVNLLFNDELILFQGLKRTIDLLAIEKELTIVYLFDRFEDYIPTLTPEFFTNLRVLRDRAKYRFAVVFSLHKPLDDLIGQDLLSDFYQFVADHTVYLPLLDKPGLEFRISYIENASGKKLKKETISAIIKATSGHPNLTRLSVETVIDTGNVILEARRADRIPRGDPIATLQDDKTQKNKRQNRDSLSEFLLSQKPIKAALFDIWKSLTPEEQNLLTTVILEARRADRIPERDPIASLQDDNQNIHLENVGLIKNNKITIPLFAQFVKHLSKQSSHISFDPKTLLDTLTSSEFKLLTFLLQNSGKIIEREEVINAVWLDTKSTAGVTDQALDQLIFRLRKKIEDDPNKPRHLQTVKGRGLRFTP